MTDVFTTSAVVIFRVKGCYYMWQRHNYGFRWLGPRVFVKCWNLLYSQEKFHKQVYGISISSSKSNIAIIENPEMLKIQQRHIMKQQTLANTSKPSAPPPPLVSSTGTPTKQESSAVNGKFLDRSQIPALNYDFAQSNASAIIGENGFITLCNALHVSYKTNTIWLWVPRFVKFIPVY